MAPAHKAPDKRDKIIRTAMATIAREGYNAATIRHLAGESGMSKTGLVHHFPIKENLLVEVLRRRDEDRTLLPTGGTARDFFAATADALTVASQDSGLTELYIRLAGEATASDHPAHQYFVDRYTRTVEAGADAISAFQRSGEIPDIIDPTVIAKLLLALVDGLQLRLLYEPDLDIAGMLHALTALLPPSGRSGVGVHGPSA